VLIQTQIFAEKGFTLSLISVICDFQSA